MYCNELSGGKLVSAARVYVWADPRQPSWKPAFISEQEKRERFPCPPDAKPTRLSPVCTASDSCTFPPSPNAICSDCCAECCGQSFCTVCGDYHVTFDCVRKPVQNERHPFPSGGFWY